MSPHGAGMFVKTRIWRMRIRCLRSRVVLSARGCTMQGCLSRPQEDVVLPGAASTTERPTNFLVSLVFVSVYRPRQTHDM